MTTPCYKRFCLSFQGDDKEKEETKGDGAKDTKDAGKEETPPKKKEGKKKIKLELTDDQKFVDGNDVSFLTCLYVIAYNAFSIIVVCLQYQYCICGGKWLCDTCSVVKI